MAIKIPLNFVPIGPIKNNPAFGSDKGLAPTRPQVIIWTNDDLVHRRLYAALGGDELK